MLNSIEGQPPPILSELDNLSPGAKAALAQAHSTLASGATPPMAGLTGGTADQPAAAPVRPIGGGATPSLTGSTNAPAAPVTPIASPRPIPTLGPKMQPEEAELERVRSSGSGISQIHNPFLHGLGVAADSIASGLFPRIAAEIPGTEAHHQQVLGADQAAVNNERTNETTALKNAETEAQTKNFELQPELRQTKAALDAEKQHEVESNHQSQNDIKKAGNQSALHEHGFKQDEEGNIVPLAYEEMSEPQKAVHDLKASQQEVADATAQLKKAQKDNIPAQMDLAQKRIANAQSNQSVALQRLGLSRDQFNARNYGVGHDGQALPGSILGDDGKPVGSSFQQNVRPTGQERNKADLASSAHDQLADIKSIVQKRPDIFGPAAGRKTDFDVWLGSQDPDAQRFRAARTIAGDHLAGVFGGRSEAALHALDSAIGQFKDNPQAVVAGIDQLDKANNRFVEKGTPKTAGSNAAAAAHPTGAAPESTIPYTANGKTYHIPASHEQEFLKDFPTAKKANAKQ